MNVIYLHNYKIGQVLRPKKLTKFDHWKRKLANPS